MAIPGPNVVGPLICWLIWKQDYPLVDQIGKNVINAQISWEFTCWCPGRSSEF